MDRALGERRICTVVFCDVAGSTALAESRDPEEWADVMSGAFAALVPAITRYDGTVARMLGDAVLAYFGAPTAHEDDPERAILAALEMIDAIHRYRETLADPGLAGLDARLGINTGLVVLRDIRAGAAIEYTALGDVVNVAARLQSAATPGSVVVSEPTQRLVAGSFTFRPLGDLALKGRAAATAAYEVTGRVEAAHAHGPQRRRAPLIGRDAELGTLREAAMATRRGEGAAVAVIGEPGLGKSRLLGELRAYWRASRLEQVDHWSESRGESFARSQPYHLLQAHILEMCDAREGEDVASVRSKLAHGDSGCCASGCSIATALGSRPEAERGHALAALGELLAVTDVGERTGPPPEVQRDDIVGLVRDITERHIAGGVGVFVFDDLHWSDVASVDVIVELARLVRALPVLIVLAFRPEHDSAVWRAREALRSACAERYREIELAPLTAAETATAARALAPDADPATIAAIQQRAEGNPFFIEELAALAATPDRLPDTVQLAIAAQVDRLDEPERRVLQIASVAGRSIAESVLRRLTADEAGADTAIARLGELGFLIPETTATAGRYVFRHALVQESVYAMLVQRARRELHQRVADVLIALAADRVDDEAAVIAHHLVRSGSREALPWLVRAGDRALRLHALDDALAEYDAAFALAIDTDDRAALADVYTKRARTLELRSSYAEAVATYEDMAHAGRARGDQAMEANALHRLATLLSIPTPVYDPVRAEAVLDQAAEIARGGTDRLLLADIEWSRTLRDQWAGRWASAEAAGRSAAQVFRELGVTDRLATALNTLSHVYRETGRIDEARDAMTEALELFRSVGNVPMTIDSLGILAFTELFAGRSDEVLRRAAEGRRLSDEIRHDFGRADTVVYFGILRHEQGDLGGAIQAYEETLGFARAAGHVGAEVSTAPLIAHAYRDAGAFDRAAQRLDEGEAGARQHMDQWVGWILTERARLAIAQGRPADARAMIEQASAHRAVFLHLLAEVSAALASIELSLAAGDPRAAAEPAAAEAARLRSSGIAYALADFEWLEGEGLRAAGDLVAATAAFDRALASAGRVGSLRLRWRILAGLADVRDARGDQDGAAGALREAREITDTIERSLAPLGLTAAFAALPSVRALRTATGGRAAG